MGDPLPRFDPTDTETLVYSSDPRGELLSKITTNKNDPGPGNKKTRFGRGDDGTVRLWVGDRDEVVSLIFTGFHYLPYPYFATEHSQKSNRSRGMK